MTTNGDQRENVEVDEEEQNPLLIEDSDSDQGVSGSVRLATDQRALSLSLNAIRFCVFADAVTATVLDPNFPFMTIPGAHPDSFKSTSPFGVSAATYFLPMTALLGSAMASTIIGAISDKVGRKSCLLACLVVGAIGAITNFLARRSFWGFCASNFAQGLFAASLPVAMAYVSDVKPSRKDKDAEIGVLVALNMIGISGGGILAILMETQGLFAPLFVGAALNVVAAIFTYCLVLEPNKTLFQSSEHDDDDEEVDESPAKLDKPLLTNIIAGALLDNVGSAGLIPIAMAPLALDHFYIQFVAQDQDPIMNQSAFKWLSVMVALTVIPGAALSQVVFDKVGAAAACVFGNAVTGIMIIALLYIALIEPATNGSYAGFIAALYAGFPFTVLSQLSTGPMLDMLAPAEKRGLVQGLNIAVMNFATAISPYGLGEMADNLGVKTTMWACIGTSFAAALVNFPLVFSAKLKRPPPKPPKYARALKGEDSEMIERLLRGEWVPARFLEDLNEERMKKGEPYLVLPYGSYENDKHRLDELRAQARDDFLFLKHRNLEYLCRKEMKHRGTREQLVQDALASRATSEQQRHELAQELGTWFADYLLDSGYWIDDSPITYKQMILNAFPVISHDKEINADNVEQMLVNNVKLLNQYLAEDKLGKARTAFAHSQLLT